MAVGLHEGVADLPTERSTMGREERRFWGIFLNTALTFKKSHLPLLKFQLLSIWTNPYKLGHKIFKKDQNTLDFYFLKK
jgi:hypothetical protein